MNVTLSLDDRLVKKVRKIAVDRDTTLTGLVRSYLETLAAEDPAAEQKKREMEALEQSFKTLKFTRGVAGSGLVPIFMKGLEFLDTKAFPSLL